jgi:hypothetical protein
LPTPAVANRLAHGFDRILQRRLTHELLGPDLRTELLLGDDAVVMCKQVGEDLEHLAAQVDDLPGAAQLIALRVKLTGSENVDHGGIPSPQAHYRP